ncbi:MAG TPA: transporter substrate-binding domain-containing protein, partial [Acidimicrobiia bacterium]|nr:transporter substrate-binding domain-containing protein [Acidimicrobiia bacterium]
MTMLAVLALALAACSPAADDGGDTTTSAAGDTTTSAAADTTTSAGGDTSTTGDASALPDLEGRTVTVAVENAYLPFNFILAGETEGQGWDYDAWRDICERLNCVPEFVEAAWPAVIDQVAQGEFDTAADGISITDERKEIVDFSEPYMVVQQKFIVGLDDDRFATAQDLIDDPDATIATQVGTTNFELAAELVGEDRIQAFDQFGLAIQALIAGDVDAVIIDDAAGLGYIGENADQIKTIDDPLQSDPLGFIYPQGSDLVDPVNQAIAAMAEDGTMEELGRKWFGP